MSKQMIADLAARFHPDVRITVLTGAGVSAASGVPTFRGAGGLWKQYKPEDLATAAAFNRDPRLVWEWYDWRRQILSDKKPNAAHQVLATWSRRYPHFTLVTQNVDRLHEDAGTQNIVRFHGSIWDVSCWKRCLSSPVTWLDKTVPYPDIPPHCPYCGGLIRPAVVWFGEAVNPVVLERSRESADCDLFLTIGTSSLVYPAAGLVYEAKSRGAYTVEINVEPTSASSVLDNVLAGPAEEILPVIEQAIKRTL